MDPNSIESVNVIKGANGAALYGSQASNGVLVITTKGKIKKSTNESKSIEKIKNYTGSLKVKNIKNNSSYMKAYSSANSADEAYDIFLKQRNIYEDNPSYYADVFSYFFEWNDKNKTRTLLNYILQVENQNILINNLVTKIDTVYVV